MPVALVVKEACFRVEEPRCKKGIERGATPLGHRVFRVWGSLSCPVRLAGRIPASQCIEKALQYQMRAAALAGHCRQHQIIVITRRVEGPHAATGNPLGSVVIWQVADVVTGQQQKSNALPPKKIKKS